MASLKNTIINDTGYLQLPSGTTAQRPSSPATGYMRRNTTEGHTEVYDGSAWVELGETTAGPYSVDFLVAAGGGGGGPYIDGGGGAGGLRTSYGSTSGGGASAETDLILSPGTQYAITIGGGGAGAILSPTNDNPANGNNSIFSTITSIGGGAASGFGTFSAQNGGSGGGTRYQTSPVGQGTVGQGFAGGLGNPTSTTYGGGGGGAAGVGNGTGNGQAGLGLAVSITGSSLTYSTGGAGGIAASGNGVSGANNTGNGGQGNGQQDVGGNGGSGIVILRMPTANYSGTTTGNPTVSTDGTDTILTYTSSGTYTA